MADKCQKEKRKSLRLNVNFGWNLSEGVFYQGHDKKIKVKLSPGPSGSGSRYLIDLVMHRTVVIAL